MSARIAALVLGALAFSLSACATSEEDRAFFQDGWRHPEKGAEKRMSTSGW